MNKPFYSFEELILEGGYAYTFESVGKQGSITKLVFFQEIEPDLYNLALVDFDLATQAIDDMSISDNQDMAKIFATVFRIVTDFFQCLAYRFSEHHRKHNIETSAIQSHCTQ